MTRRAATAAVGDRESVGRILTESWGGTTVVAHGTAYNAAGLPALLAERNGRVAGLLTYSLGEAGPADGLEIVTLDAVVRHTGVGTALLAAAAEVAARVGAGRLWLVTSNDNLDALRFYQRRGMRIADVGRGAVDAARRLKPSIPLIGHHGIALHDELTLELRLPPPSR